MPDFSLPVSDFVSDGDPQVEACVLCDHTAPFTGAGPPELRYTPDLLIPIRQHQVVPVCEGKHAVKHLFICKKIQRKLCFQRSRLHTAHLVMYRRRSACRGSESLEGFILLPQSHTLLRQEVMLVDIWISGCRRERREKGVRS